MKCKICKGSGLLPMSNHSEYDENFCDCGNCGGSGVVEDSVLTRLRKAEADRDRWKARCEAVEGLHKICMVCATHRCAECIPYKSWQSIVKEMEADR